MTWLTIGDAVRVYAKKTPNKLAVKDINRSLSFSEFNERTNRLGNALLNLGLKKGDKVACLLNNSLEFMEIYIACAKTGLVTVPINFRLSLKEIEYILDNSEARGYILAQKYVEPTERARTEVSLHFKEKLKGIRHIVIGEEAPKRYLKYEQLVAEASPEKSAVKVNPEDTWIMLYTSGTTGVPKGVIRSHRSYISFFLINEVEFGFQNDDYGLVLMPLAHVNSTFYSFVFTYIGASVYVHRETHFDPRELLELIQKERITYTSLIPTHYALILGIPPEERNKYDMSSIRSLLCSSAPARKKMKREVMEFFPNAKLFEAYGSTEAGLVTLLRPEEQMTKLGSIGREIVGTDLIKLLDENGNEVPIGEVGELYSKGPMMFDEYWKLPEKTKSSFRDEWFSAGDLAKKDENGYFYIVDRKDNMIITGGEHVYPSEVEEVLCTHDSVFDTAIIGLPHEKWGEAVTAVVVLKEGKNTTEEELIDLCGEHLASFKKPKKVIFISPDEMPRTASGKILHKRLRDKYGGAIEDIIAG